MKKLVFILALLIVGFFSGCDQKCQGVVCTNGGQCIDGVCHTLPVVITVSISNITQEEATCNGNLTSNGGPDDAERGICFSTTNTEPTVNDVKITDNSGGGTGTFSVPISGLSNSTTYFVRAFSINKLGVGYGDVITFTTLGPNAVPQVTTSPVINITGTLASCGGNVTYEGGSAVTERGVCWNTSPNPTIANNHTSNGSGTGSFTSSMTSLTPVTTYYGRAYASNSNGTGYGTSISFTTATGGFGPNVADASGNYYSTVWIGSQLWMKTNLRTTKYQNGNNITHPSDAVWSTTTQGAYDEFFVNPYGYHYNFYAVSDPRNICPNGWHIPTMADLEELLGYLGGSSVAGGKMKETGYDHWYSPNTGATNSSNFTALPGGEKLASGGQFQSMWTSAVYWTSTEYSSTEAYPFLLGRYSEAVTYGVPWEKRYGASCRCLQD